ncbi:MAG: hypothetical protein JNK82_17915 [Myxococcaceae bacterium]|nr:hypothetical protein [Myxococcaceae bacterium]
MTSPINKNLSLQRIVVPQTPKPEAKPLVAPTFNRSDRFEVAPARTAIVSDDAKDRAEELLYISRGPTGLASALREAGDDAELRRALIVEAFDSGDPAAYLNGEIFTGSRKGHVNEGYDDLTEVADAVGEAYRAGDITDEQLKELVEDLGPDQAAVVAQTLALGQNNGGIGGVVEAFGVAAKDLGYDEAAALALTSTDLLIDAHYPSAEAQREAFGHIDAFIERYQYDLPLLDANLGLRNAIGAAVTNAARLTALGNGYDPAEKLDEVLDTLGPDFVGEIIAQAGERLYNDPADGPLDVLGDAARRLAGDDADSPWRLNSVLAYTQSTSLLEANIPPDELTESFEVLNAYLAESRDEWSLAEHDEYSLVRAPQAVEGLNRLLSTHPEVLTELLDAGPEGEASVVQLFESIALIPEVPQAERDKLTRTVQGYVEDQLASVTAEGRNADDVGERIGRLFGTLQVAANRAVEDAEAGDSDVKTLALNFGADVLGVAARVGLTASVGPLGAGVAQVVVSTVLRNLFAEDPPTRDEVEGAFADRLRAAGIEISAGERGYDELSELYRELHTELTAQLTNPDLTQAERNALQVQIEVTQGLLNGLSTYGDTIDSDGGAAGELNDVLRGRGDEP